MASFLDKELDFKPAIEALKRTLGILFPFSSFMKTTAKAAPNYTGAVFNIKNGHPVIIRSEKIMTQYEKMYGKFESPFTLDMIKTGLKREICDEIMRSDLFEWSIEDTAMGTRVGARITISDFNSSNTSGTTGTGGMAGNLGTSGPRSHY